MSSSPIRSHSGILRSLRSIKRADGIRSLWRGLPSVVVGAGSSHSSYNEGRRLKPATGPAHAIYFVAYETVKEALGGNDKIKHHPFAAGMGA